MALSASTVFEINASATASNVNGGGFNPANANMATDLAATSATGNSPVVTSASYNFVAGDVGNWLYIQSGTNWSPGWYKIASVAANAATLSAAVGAAVQVSGNKYLANTVSGCATTASPTGGVWTIDYSQSTAAVISPTDLASVGSSTTLTSASGLFTVAMVGNLLHLNNAGTGSFGTVGWYEFVSYTNSTTMVTDRTTNSGTAMVAGQGKIGGALSLNSSDVSVFNLAVSSSTAATRFFIKGNQTYTINGGMTITAAGNADWPVVVEGYNALRGDRPADFKNTGTTRPIISGGANAIFLAANWDAYSLIVTGNSTAVLTTGSFSHIVHCKFVNNSTTTARTASTAASNAMYVDCEMISPRGIGLSSGSGITLTGHGNYIHDCDIGVQITTGQTFLYDNIIADCVTTCFNINGANINTKNIVNNTFYGTENKQGTAIAAITGSTVLTLINNNFYGFVTAIAPTDVNTVGYDNFNNYYNNTNDVNSATKWQKGSQSISVNPSFFNVAQLTGSTATTSGSVLTQSGGNFSSLVDNQDYVYIKSGTGATVGKFLVTAHTTTTITLDSAPGNSSGGDVVWQITIGHNFLPTGNI